MCSAIGVPVVKPSKVPERMRTWSGSWRWVTNLLWPGRRRSRKGWMSASVSVGYLASSLASRSSCEVLSRVLVVVCWRAEDELPLGEGAAMSAAGWSSVALRL